MTISALLDRPPAARAADGGPPRPRRTDRSTRLPASSAVSAASSATGMSAVPALTTAMTPRPRSGAGVGPTTTRARHGQVARRRAPPPATTGGGLRADARRQRGGTRRRELDQDRRDLLGRLPLAEHHLREAGAQVAVRVDARELESAERQLAQLAQRLVDRRTPALHRLQQGSQTLRDPCGAHDITSMGPRGQPGTPTPSEPVAGSQLRMLVTSVSHRERLAHELLARGRRCGRERAQHDDRDTCEPAVLRQQLEHLPARHHRHHQVEHDDEIAPRLGERRKSIACLPFAAGMTSKPSLSSRSCSVSRTS